jgi:hypothetical protein
LFVIYYIKYLLVCYCSGKVECILYGEYVSLFQQLIAENSGKLNVIVIQFGVIKLFRGIFSIMFIHFMFFNIYLYFVFFFIYCVIVDKVSIQNVDSATRIYFDPPFKDVVSFKNRLVYVDFVLKSLFFHF